MIAPVVLGAPHVSCDHSVEHVSRERCYGYGAHWSPERSARLTGGFGMSMSSFAPAGRSFGGGVSQSRNGGYAPVRFDGTKLGVASLHTTSVEARFHGQVWDGFYLGGSIGFGWGRVKSQTVQTESLHLEDDPSVDLLHLRVGVLVGYRIPLHWFSIRIESLVGTDVLALDQYGVARTGQRTGVTSFDVTALVEPRLALDVWASPWTTLSFYAGKNALRAHDHTLGFTISGHLRPFDGEFRHW